MKVLGLGVYITDSMMESEMGLIIEVLTDTRTYLITEKAERY